MKIPKKTLLFILIISQIISIKDDEIKNLKCSDVEKEFPLYKCLQDRKIAEGASGIAFKAYKDETLYILKAQKSNTSKIEKNSDLNYLLKLQNTPGIIQLEEYTFKNDLLFEVLEFGELGDLKKNLNTKYFKNQKNILKCFKTLITTINTIHDKNIIHADLKSENIVLKANNSPKIIDFDLSVKLNSKKGGRGTVPYMDPLIIESWGKYHIRYTPAVDIFSLGIILYEMITKKVPFKGSMSEVYFAQRLDSYVIPKGTFRILAVLVEGCLQRKLSKRFDGDRILDLVHRFEVFAENSGVLDQDLEIDMNQKILSFDESDKVESEVLSRGGDRVLFFFAVCMVGVFFVMGIIFWRIWRDLGKEEEDTEKQPMEISIVNEED